MITLSFSHRRACLALALFLCLLLSAPAGAEKLQDCHRVSSSHTDTTQANSSVIRLWQVETALPAVTEEINGLASAWAAELGPDLPKAGNKTSRNSRLDVEIRYSRTGLHWLSFLVQARTTWHRELTDQRIASRTWNMETGARIRLQDLFDDSDEVWNFLSQRVRDTLTDYWPEETPAEEALDALCRPEALMEADFTLHGMSLTLHYPASQLYEGKHTLMEVRFYYPEIREWMTEEAYYKTCALTFDDGPHATNTALTLNALMETGAPATFFVIGNRVADYFYLVQREHDEGHAVASHNWHHGDVRKATPAQLRAMPGRVNESMRKVIGIPVRYDRVPGGLYPSMVKAGVNWAYIQWSLDTYDWRGIATSSVLSKVKKKIQDGDIILCHDVKPNTPESARQIVRYLKEQGYMLLTVDELFAKNGVALEAGQVYYRCENGDTSKRENP